jgi:hypothetical protein
MSKIDVGQVWIHKGEKDMTIRVESISPDTELIYCVEITESGFRPCSFWRKSIVDYFNLAPHYDTPLYQALNGRK